jgi:hypothetical protein
MSEAVLDDVTVELLIGIAQIALGVAGFSGIAMYFKRKPGPLTNVEVYRIAILFFNSFAAVFLSLVPFPLQQFGLSESTVWRLSSGLVAIFEIIFHSYYLPRSQRYRRQVPEIFSLQSLTLTYTGGLSNTVLQTLNAFGLAGRHYEAIFMIGVMWLLFHATFQFGRILFIQPIDEPVSPEPEHALAIAGDSSATDR